jgi:hypothetical protein
MRHLESSAPRSAADQADGLRRLFAGTRQRIVPLVANGQVEQPGVLLERLTSALAELGASVLVVDAADTSPAAHELVDMDLPGCIEHLGGHVHYLAARGLPLRHVNARGSSEAWLARLETTVPRADAIVLHASARDLVRLIGRRPLRPVLMASLAGGSLTEAYTAMKLLSQRSGLQSFDVLVGMGSRPRRAQRMAERLADTGDTFLGTVVRAYAAVDCDLPLNAPLDAALLRLATEQLLNDDAGLPVLHRADGLPRPVAAPGSALSSLLY